MPDFLQQLQDQLIFIRNSADAVARGDLREAVRIATAVRVIAHQTPTSTSLLTHLGMTNPRMLSTGVSLGPKVLFGESGLTQIVLTQNTMAIVPALDNGPTKRIVPFDEWWSERVFILNSISLTRKQLVLAAANKDGGAHVDMDLPENYTTLLRGLWTSQNGEKLNAQAMLTLVQVGFEMNHSPGILAALGAPPPAFLSKPD